MQFNENLGIKYSRADGYAPLYGEGKHRGLPLRVIYFPICYSETMNSNLIIFFTWSFGMSREESFRCRPTPSTLSICFTDFILASFLDGARSSFSVKIPQFLVHRHGFRKLQLSIASFLLAIVKALLKTA